MAMLSVKAFFAFVELSVERVELSSDFGTLSSVSPVYEMFFTSGMDNKTDMLSIVLIYLSSVFFRKLLNSPEYSDSITER